jgi:hypothetical protein
MRSTITLESPTTVTPTHSASCAAALIASDALRLALRTETDHAVVRQMNTTLGALSALRHVTHEHCQH